MKLKKQIARSLSDFLTTKQGLIQAAQILALVAERIKAIENPYREALYAANYETDLRIFELARKAILLVLEGKEPER